MNTTPEHDAKIAALTFATVYPHYVAKVERKGRTEAELIQVIQWLTGFDAHKQQELRDSKVDFSVFFTEATLHPNACLITGVICGYSIEEIKTPLTQQIRYLDKLVDELAKGKKMEKILRKDSTLIHFLIESYTMIRIIYSLLIIASIFACSNKSSKIPDDFNFYFEFNFTDKVNTFDSTFTREMNDGDTSILILFSREEKQEFYNVLIANDYEKIPNSFVKDQSDNCIQPHSVDRLIIEANGFRRIFNYSLECPPQPCIESDHYVNIRAFLIKLIRSKKLDRKLPSSNMIFM